MPMIIVRYKYIKQVVNDLFIDLNIKSYPIDILGIYSEFNNCKAIPYSEHMKNYNLIESEVFEHFGSEEGCTFYNSSKKRYLIFYNDLNIYYKTPERRRWTLAHELGHVLLNHHTLSNKTVIFRNALTTQEYEWMEKEANHFASLLLANPIILNELNIKGNFDIMEICNLSEEASSYRYQGYLKWKKHKYINKYDKLVILQFYDFIHKKRCLNCNYGFISENATYCPICGGNLIWGDGVMKYKKGVELDERGRALVCPKCDNEDVDEFDIYCKICGGYLYQECGGVTDYDCNNEEYHIEEGCDILLDSNARYCTQCGKPTTFFKYGYLNEWEKEKQEIQETQAQATSTISFSDDDIPF